MDDLISRQAAIDLVKDVCDAIMSCCGSHYDEETDDEVYDDIREIDAILKCNKEMRIALKNMPSAQPKTDEENELKFYYVESIDDYWIGQRLDNFYYADWHDGFGFVWSKSRYLPWGEHVVNEQTLWKEHTYPSEPKEIPFTIWIVGFLEKYSTEPKTGECRTCGRNADNGGVHEDGRTKCPIQEHYALLLDGYCHLYEPYNCGAKMKGADQAAIDALHMHLMYRMGTDSNKKRLDEWINNLPSAQPKTGKWIIKDNPGTGWYRVTCSECGEDVTSAIPMIGFFPNAKPLWDYCPYCGCKTEVEE